ncbi:FAD-dependent oxidoreductase [Cohnella sp. CFH 77786]|uniref:glycerol-3-phosphate dehydrogenase/oxidase n=1 Tax=Cohnella sp. CFH 77786 TaxID=2662265 RepID=UPI001C60F12C|nr:FAD-dependent oxidoreductase [Cohnella sp. CFH 77786]MBW5445657.1 FAD-dependent oxidoreductase [Cohnella sp. CFH 77786]
MQPLSGKHRAESIKQLGEETFDVLVIGGGITGAGIALDAATRGMHTALIDMQDFAAGTSSRSTKLVHGGLRYLKQLEVKMVAEVGKERAVVYGNAPHVTTPEWMLLPIYQGGTFGRFSTSLGLMLYDFLAGVKREERRSMLSARETLLKEPLLRSEGLLGGGYYVEYRTDDARLTIEVVKKAAERGAVALNYVRAAELLYDGKGQLSGVTGRDMLSGETFPIRARQVVNASGPWVDEIREMDRSRKGKTLRLTKGVHLVFDQSRFPLRQAIYFDVDDGRMMFAIPRDGKTYIGTTDTDYAGDPAEPGVTAEDREYIVKAANSMFPGLRLSLADIESEWSGVRPLIYEEGKSPSEISRKDEIFRSPSGLITIAGGKLTGYRKMAETVTDLLARELGHAGCGPYGPCITKTLPLAGGDFGGPASFPAFIREQTVAGIALGLGELAAERLARRYGTNVAAVYAVIPEIREDANLRQIPLDLYAALRYGMDEEMAMRPDDFLIRRTGALFFEMDTVIRHYRQIIDIMAVHYGWNEEQTRSYVRVVEREIQERGRSHEWIPPEGHPRRPAFEGLGGRLPHGI